MNHRTLAPVALATLLALPGSALAQDTPKPARPEAVKPDAQKAETSKADTTTTETTDRGPHGITLRVQLVISRFQGEKKLASLPYALVVTTGGGRARMRMGVDTPVPVTTFAPAENVKPHTSYQYRTVGTNIDCAAHFKAGRYQLSISVENSSALALDKGPSDDAKPSSRLGDANLAGIPLFRRFEANLDPVLRDGESVQTIASTDPVTGEVVKIDVTINVVK